MTPRATYRVQFHADFTFADAQRLAPYWAKLGVSHVYASPLQKARPGSTHGYDVVDHTRISEVMVRRPALERLAADERLPLDKAQLEAALADELGFALSSTDVDAAAEAARALARAEEEAARLAAAEAEAAAQEAALAEAQASIAAGGDAAAPEGDESK